MEDISFIAFSFTAVFVFVAPILHSLFHKKNSQHWSDILMQSDQPDEPKKRSKKDRKGKKNKKKRDKGSKGKGKRKGKGKGKKGSRKKKHEEEVLEEGFLKISTTLPEYPSQEPFQPTELPELKKNIENPTEVFYEALTEMPTHEPDSTTEAPTLVPSSLPESKVSEEVDKFTCTPPQPVPAICNSN